MVCVPTGYGKSIYSKSSLWCYLLRSERAQAEKFKEVACTMTYIYILYVHVVRQYPCHFSSEKP